MEPVRCLAAALTARVSRAHLARGNLALRIPVPPGRPLSLRANAALDPLRISLKDRSTRIVCTIGPASLDRLTDLVLAGMDVARINCAHGDAENYARIVSGVRTACADVAPGGARPAGARRADARHVAIGFDIKGPEIRTGRFGAAVPPSPVPGGEKEVRLRRGDVLTLTSDAAFADAGRPDLVYIAYPPLAAAVAVGHAVIIDDGNVELRVTAVDAAARRVTVVSLTDAPVGERKGVNLPGLATLDLPFVTAKDGADIALAARLGADFLFASFVQSAAHVAAVRAAAAAAVEAAATTAAAAGGGAAAPPRVPRIIAKIENQAGIDAFDEILRAADGIMVARGDLGVQIAPERVYLAQKMMVARANAAGKPVICATQMLESMTTHPRPTRAEVSDVAGAVFDGCDAVMLSGETAKGAFPVEATRAMATIAQAGEAAFPTRAFFNEAAAAAADAHHSRRQLPEHAAHAAAGVAAAAAAPEPACEPRISDADTETLCASAVLAALDVGSPLLLVLTRTGRTAASLARFRPPCPVVALTADAAVARALKLVRGVQAAVVPGDRARTTADMRAFGLALAADMGLTRPRSGDRIVVVAGAGVMWHEGGVHVSIVTV